MFPGETVLHVFGFCVMKPYVLWVDAGNQRRRFTVHQDVQDVGIIRSFDDRQVASCELCCQGFRHVEVLDGVLGRGEGPAATHL